MSLDSIRSQLVTFLLLLLLVAPSSIETLAMQSIQFCQLIYRMKTLLKRLKRDEISKNDVVKNLEYVVKVLEKVYDGEKR